MKKLLFVLLCILLVPGSSAAQGAGGFGIGGTKSGDFAGFTLTGFLEGYWSVLRGELIADVSTGPGSESDRYYRDDIGGGQSRCRDSNTGQFVEDAKCQQLDFGFALGVGSSIFLEENRLLFGAGYRLGKNHSTPYGSIGYRFSFQGPSWMSVGLSIGDRYVRGLISMGWPFQ